MQIFNIIKMCVQTSRTLPTSHRNTHTLTLLYTHSINTLSHSLYVFDGFPLILGWRIGSHRGRYGVALPAYCPDFCFPRAVDTGTFCLSHLLAAHSPYFLLWFLLTEGFFTKHYFIFHLSLVILLTYRYQLTLFNGYFNSISIF